MAYLRRYLLGNAVQSGPGRSGVPVTGADPRQRPSPAPTTPAAPGAGPSPAAPTATPLQAGSGDPGTLRAFFLANREAGQRQADALGSDLNKRLTEAEQKLPGLTQEAPPTPQGQNPADLDPGLAKQREDLLSPIRDDINIAGQGGGSQVLAKGAGPGYTPTMGALDSWLLQGAGFNVDPYRARLSALEGQSPYRIKGEAAPQRPDGTPPPKPDWDQRPEERPQPDWDQRPRYPRRGNDR